jgi:hypothetical protein
VEKQSCFQQYNSKWAICTVESACKQDPHTFLEDTTNGLLPVACQLLLRTTTDLCVQREVDALRRTRLFVANALTAIDCCMIEEAILARLAQPEKESFLNFFNLLEKRAGI